MPSTAYYYFKKNINQAEKLLQAFNDLRTPQRGRKHLDHLTRASIMFICSSWEVYIEQIAEESGEKIVECIYEPTGLPKTVQKTIANKIRSSKHELEPIKASVNWRNYYCELIKEYTGKLNTPKKYVVMELFNKFLGISGDRINNDLPSLSKINEIVNCRCEIAHNVFIDEYVKEDLVLNYKKIIEKAVVEIEVLLWKYIPEVTKGKKPWQNTY